MALQKTSAPEQDSRRQGTHETPDSTVVSDDIKDAVSSIMGSMQDGLSTTDIQLYTELKSLAEFIKTAKSDIAAICPDEITADYIPAATHELDAIVEATASATNRIMDCTEVVTAEIGNVSSVSADKLTEATTGIFEACGFQDITGQRITKVIGTLKEIEIKVNGLVDAFGAELERYRTSLPKDKKDDTSLKTDEDLLGGPQLKDQAQTQEEIDALLASFD